jgi:hypothetical protein
MSMSEIPGADIFSAIDPRISEAMNEGRFHDALVLAFAAYLAFRQENDPKQLFVQAALVWIEVAVMELQKASGAKPATAAEEPQCSFCGQKPPNVRLVAGASAFICDSCVTTAGEALNAGDAGGASKTG